MGKEAPIQVQEVQRVAHRKYSKRNIPRHISIKLITTKDKEKILKATNNIQGNPPPKGYQQIFQQKLCSPEGKRFKVMKGVKLQPIILCPARNSFRFDREIKSFPDQQKQKRIWPQKASFTMTAKGTSLSRKEKATTRNKKITNGKVHQ